jgi:hypothetical protein
MIPISFKLSATFFALSATFLGLSGIFYGVFEDHKKSQIMDLFCGLSLLMCALSSLWWGIFCIWEM